MIKFIEIIFALTGNMKIFNFTGVVCPVFGRRLALVGHYRTAYVMRTYAFTGSAFWYYICYA